MPHLHLSSLVTKKKIETIVIFFHSTSRLCTYPYLAHLLYIIKCVPHCPVHTPPSAPPPTAHLSIPPQHPIRRTPRQERQARQQNTPATAHPTSTTCGQPSIATTPNVGAPFMTPLRHADTKITRLRETAGEPNTCPYDTQTPRQAAARLCLRKSLLFLALALAFAYLCSTKIGCGSAKSSGKRVFPCLVSRLSLSLHQANGKMPAAVP